VAGEDCLIIKTRVEDTAALEAVIKRVRSRITVLRSVTMIALSALKEGGALDVGLPSAEPAEHADAAPASTNGQSRTARAARK
jgi:hypothetical protein